MSDRSPENRTDSNNNGSTRSAGLESTSRVAPSSDVSSRQEAQVDVVEEERLYDPEYTKLILGEDRPSSFTLADKAFYPVNMLEEEVANRFANQRTCEWSESEDSAIDSIGGLSEIMTTVWNTIRYPLDCPEFCQQFRPTKGVILHGPNGVGKTMLIQALVEGCSRSSPKITAFRFAVYLDNIDKSLAKLFHQAKQRRPSIILLDHFDSLAYHDSPNVQTLGALMDEMDDSGSVFVIAATDQLDRVDPALRKPRRFEKEILIDLPNFEARKDILYKMTSTWSLQPSVIDAVGNETQDYTGADLSALCRTAYMNALERTHPNFWRGVDVQPGDFSTIVVKVEDFKEALSTVQSTKQRQQNS